MKKPASSVASQVQIGFEQFRDGKNASTWWSIFITLIVATIAIRFYNIHEPDQVCWDEAHFGKYANYYINRTFFFDVHPPLGKMLIGLFGYLDGYNASFPFELPGDKFLDYPYLGMRIGCATLGAFLVPLSFLTVWEMTSSLPAATFAGLLNLLDNGMTTLNKFLLLDPPMLFFISASTYTMVKFNNMKDRPFTLQWWCWLSMIGIMLAGSISVKFVGVFIVLLVGIRAVVDLWDFLGDMSRPVSYTIKHFMARVVCLIILPLLLYTGVFYIHLTLLNKSGPGDGFFSSAFQISLEGNYLQSASTPKEVAYGAVISIKSHVTGSGYLHSHEHVYPAHVSGAGYQQITSYAHKDDNNLWQIKRFNRFPPSWNSTKPIDFVRNGDYLRLEHLETGKNLHAHKELSPLTTKHFQVVGYGEDGEGDSNDYWRLEIEGGEEKEILKTMRHRFRLIHHNLNCALNQNSMKYPAWGFEQEEVACNPKIKAYGTLWNVEDNRFPRLPNTSFKEYELTFFQRFIESHVVMLTGNSGLKPKEGELTSRPWMWPINFQGQWFSAVEPKVYLLGNPIIWWGNLVLLGFFSILSIAIMVRGKRRVPETTRQKILSNRMLNACTWLLIGWILHYLPFWPMTRVLYFHHYFPAVLFASMMSGIILDYIFETISEHLPSNISTKIYILLIGTTIFILVKSFYAFAPLVYGMTGDQVQTHTNNSTLRHLKWFSTWEFA